MHFFPCGVGVCLHTHTPGVLCAFKAKDLFVVIIVILCVYPEHIVIHSMFGFLIQMNNPWLLQLCEKFM